MVRCKISLIANQFGRKAKVFFSYFLVPSHRFSCLYTTDKRPKQWKGNKKVKAKWGISFGFLIEYTTLRQYPGRLPQTFEKKGQGI
jgi:hypothetical protein